MASVKHAWIKKYGEIEGTRKWNELNLGKGTLDWYVNRYGNVDGEIRYIEKNKKLSVSVEALRLAGKSDSEILEIRNRHASKSKQTLDNMISRYGDTVGIEKYQTYRNRNKLTSNRRLEYWIDKCSGDIVAAKKLLKDHQRRDLNWFINTYGDIDGIERYYITNRKRGRTLENYVAKYGSDNGLSRYIDSCRKWKAGQRGIFNSSGQIELETYLSTLYTNVKGNRSETGIILTDLEKSNELKNNILYPDIIVNDKYIIEYNGDFWHANKTIFPDDDTIVGKINKPAGLIRKIDMLKHEIYKKRGFVPIIIWDSEWHADKENVKKLLKSIIL